MYQALTEAWSDSQNALAIGGTGILPVHFVRAECPHHHRSRIGLAFGPCGVDRLGGFRERFLVFDERQWFVRTGADDDIVAARPVALHVSEGFSQQPLDAIARHGVADGSRDGQADAGVVEIVGDAVDEERAGGDARGGGEDHTELRAAGEFHAAREGEGF